MSFINCLALNISFFLFLSLLFATEEDKELSAVSWCPGLAVVSERLVQGGVAGRRSSSWITEVCVSWISN